MILHVQYIKDIWDDFFIRRIYQILLMTNLFYLCKKKMMSNYPSSKTNLNTYKYIYVQSISEAYNYFRHVFDLVNAI